MRARLCVWPLFMVLVCASGCAGFEPDVYTPLNYTEDDSIRIEIKRIEEMKDTEPVRALWRSQLLVNSVSEERGVEAREQFNRLCDEIREKCREAEKESDYISAKRYISSLMAVGASVEGALSSGLEALQADYLSQVPGLNPIEGRGEAGSQRVSSFIQGTVTIWVDRGIRVERGMGFVDVVIGSGFFISDDGYIVTNYHVIESEVNPSYEGFSRLYIKLAGDANTRIPAKVVGWDPVLDLALLKTAAAAPYVFSLGSSEDLDVGDRIYAIGSPVGLERTLTSGIVSASKRELFSVGNALQIDAAVNSGNSGGPIIDAAGNVQGIVFAGIAEYQGLNFAIPVEYLRLGLPLLFSGGEREHPWIGAYGHNRREGGVETDYVMPGSSADRSGIGIGDLILSVNGRPVYDMNGLHEIFMAELPESIVKIEVRAADGRTEEKAVYLDIRPAKPGYEVYTHDVLARSFIPIFGMELTPIARSREYIVSKVLRGSIADESGFSENDPVTVRRIEVLPDKEALFVSIYAKKRKNGYLDVNLGFGAPLDAPNYF